MRKSPWWGAAVALALQAAPRPSWARMGAAHLLREFDQAPAAEKALIARALGARRQKKIVPELIKRLDSSAGDPELSSAIIASLGDLRRAEALGRLLEVAESTSAPPPVRLSLTGALGHLGGPKAMSVLRRSLNDPDPGVARGALAALAENHDQDSADSVIALLSNSDPGTAQAACEALGDIPGTKAQEALARALQEPGGRLKFPASYGLAKRGDKASLETLSNRLSHAGDAPEKLPAALYLARLGKLNGIDFLARTADDPASPFRTAALAALGKAGDPRGALPLIDHMKDRSPEVRLLVAQSLGMLGTGRARYALEKMRADPDEKVRAAARQASAALGDYAAP